MSWTCRVANLSVSTNSMQWSNHALASPSTCCESARDYYNALPVVDRQKTMDPNYPYCGLCQQYINPNRICACTLAMLRQIINIDISYQRAGSITAETPQDFAPIPTYVNSQSISSNLTFDCIAPSHNSLLLRSAEAGMPVTRSSRLPHVINRKKGDSLLLTVFPEKLAIRSLRK